MNSLTGSPSKAQTPSDTPAPKKERPEIKWDNPLTTPSPGLTHAVFHSLSMQRDVGYNVYLPPGLQGETKRYPVVYFLHGAGGSESSDAGGFSGLIQKEIETGHIPPVICVFPNGGMSGYVDHPEDKVMVETFITQELIPLIDSKYPTIASANGRAICGFSMGGGGAIRLALKHPDLFSAAASWAGALGSRGPSTDTTTIFILKENVDKIKGHVRLLMIVGENDLTFPAHPPMIQALSDLRIPFEYRVLPGVDHNLGTYYTQTGPDMARFITAGFVTTAQGKAK